ncbi:MAG: cyanophycinase [Fimbriimonadaceae bacterium]|nr:MAG: cyanophycinase [Fimbriimonadaceae bacterium]
MVVIALASLMLVSLPSVESREGKLFLMGGGSTTPEVAKAFIAECGGPKSLIIVMSQTRQEPSNGAGSVELLKENGAENVRLVSDSEPNNDRRKAVGKELVQARGIWIPGGDQKLFMDRWGAGWLQKEFSSALKRGTNFFGTSAGAMIMSNPMIAGPGKEKDTVEIVPGIGLTKALIDTHFRERNRAARLENGIKQTGCRQWIGLDSSEWVVLHKGEVIRVVGDALIVGVAIKK